MKVNPVCLNNVFSIKKNKYYTADKLSSSEKKILMPTYEHYISFMGGNSLDLKQSVINLNSLSNGDGSKFPPDILNMAKEVIKSGNPQDRTLIDIHKDKYGKLNDCYNLEDAKELFDEFKGVLSDKDVIALDGSFISRVKNGEIENFNKDEDLAFQLLKLYWAEGFSLNDLKQYTGTNLYHTMSKFKIPLMDRDYAHVLKFSDKEYNERLTELLAKKAMESSDRRAQKTSGEPVYIPHGPLSEIHKKHISEGLIKHYAQHPEKLTAMSKRQVEYFEKNPEQKLLLQRAMLYAWNKTQEGKSIKKHLVKFFKKYNVQLTESLYQADYDKISQPQRQALKLFWEKNGWARKAFSAAVRQGWNNVKEKKQILYNTIETCSCIGGLISIRNEILDNKIPKNISDNRDFLSNVSMFIDTLIYPETIGKRKQNIPPVFPEMQDIDKILGAIERLSKLYDQEKFLDYLLVKIKTSTELFLKIPNQQNNIDYMKFMGVISND